MNSRIVKPWDKLLEDTIAYATYSNAGDNKCAINDGMFSEFLNTSPHSKK